MEWWVGTSGYAYKEWKGSFYPADLPDAEMLRHYAGRLSAVEINQTFYRLPRADVLRGWAEQAPDRFRFCLKASRRITHFKRLAGAADETDYLVRTASALGPRAGVILYQLPPNFRLDADRLAAFLDDLPNPRRSAFEFRHPSWREESVFEALSACGAAWCTADTDDAPETEPVSTADWGYLRLRRSAYEDGELDAWAERIASAGWREAYVFFKHEEEATGPRLAERLLARADGTAGTA